MSEGGNAMEDDSDRDDMGISSEFCEAGGLPVVEMESIRLEVGEYAPPSCGCCGALGVAVGCE